MLGLPDNREFGVIPLCNSVQKLGGALQTEDAFHRPLLTNYNAIC